MRPLRVYSHQRWDGICQCPQHLLSRLAAKRRVVLFEEPVTGDAHAWLQHKPMAQGVLVLRPHVKGTAPGFHGEHTKVLRQMLCETTQDRALRDCVL